MKKLPEPEEAIYEEIKAVLKPEKSVYLDLKPLYNTREKGDRYTLDQKAEAIVHLQAHLDISENTLELEPDFSLVGEYLGINTGTLRQWWSNKQTIIDTASKLVDQLTQVSVLKNMSLMNKAQEALVKKDFNEVSVKDLVILLKTLTVVNRVNLDGGVKHVQHSHKHSIVRLVPPNTED